MRRAGIRWIRRTREKFSESEAQKRNGNTESTKGSAQRLGIRVAIECRGLAAAAEVFNQGVEALIVRGLEIEEFDAHADARLDDTDNDEAFENQIVASQFHARAAIKHQGLAGTDKAAALGNVRGNPFHFLTSLQIN